MDSKRWERIQTIFHEALALPETDRQTYLETECNGDEELLAEVAAMLEMDQSSYSFLDEKKVDLAIQIFDGSVPNLKKVGDYQIKRILGKGGMGVVYLGEHKTLHRQVAIKVLRDAFLSPARRERFKFEQQVLAKLTHPSIARLYEAEVLPDGTPYFVMEYVEGVPVTTCCKANAFTIKERLKLFRAVCEAVQHAHRQAIIHRDLKPSNILVKNDETVSLLDFGIAKQIEELEHSGMQTQTDLRMMTPAYAAPEQVRGEPMGIYTDVYGLGVLLYELLTDQLPFNISGLTPGQSEIVITEQQPEKPSIIAGKSTYASGVTKQEWDDLDVLCLTAMHKDPQRRYATVESLIRDLDHYLQGEPLEARPDTFHYRTGKFFRRNRRGITVTAIILAVLIGLVAYYTRQLAISRDVALAEMAKTQRIQEFVLNLFEGGDETVGPSDSLRVITIIEEGLRDVGILDPEPDIQAAIYMTLGGIYQNLGELDRADSLLQLSLDLQQRNSGSDNFDIVEGLVALGALRLDQAELDEAERLFREGVEMARLYYPASHRINLKAKTLLGKALQEKGNYQEAIQILKEVEGIQAGRKEMVREWLFTLGELANTYFYAGDYNTSDSLNQLLLEMNRELYGLHHPHVAEDLINIGAIRSQQGFFEEAEKYYREALDITSGFYGSNHHKTASNLSMLGRALVHQERYEEAKAIMNRALAIREQVYGNVHPKVAADLNELGAVAYQAGATDSAIAHYSRMMAIYDEIYEGPHYLKGIARSNLSGVYYGEGDYERAETLMREAVGLFKQALPPDHLDIGIGHIRLGIFLEALKRYNEAEIELLVGYSIIENKMNPSTGWHSLARSYLAKVYRALGNPETAAQFEDDTFDESSD